MKRAALALALLLAPLVAGCDDDKPTAPPTTAPKTTIAGTLTGGGLPPVATTTAVVPPPPPVEVPPATTAAPPVSYASCAEVRAAGAAPLHRGEPGYRKELDRDGDGTACEKQP